MYGYTYITLIWLDGREEKILVRGSRVRDGVLILSLDDRGEYRHIPLAQLREWKESDN